MKPYSNDLRTRVVDAYQGQKGSMRELAKRFFVSLYFVWTLIARYRRTGKVDPKPHGGGQQSKIDESGLNVLHELVKQTPDATLKELQIQLKEKKINVSRATVGRVLFKEGLPRKKKFTGNRARHRESQTTSKRIQRGGQNNKPL
jgi:transposase